MSSGDHHRDRPDRDDRGQAIAVLDGKEAPLARVTRILLALDGFEHSRRAAATALVLARRFQASVVVVHVIELHYSGLAVWSLESATDSRDLVDWLLESLRESNIDARSEIREASRGHVAREILDVASKAAVDLIVIGGAAHSILEDALLGSVTYRVLHGSRQPVLVVP